MAEAKRKPGRPPGSKNKNSGSKSGSSGSGRSNSRSRAQERAREIQAERKADRRVMDEIWALIAIAVGVFLIVATFTGGAGEFGRMIGDALKGVLGFIAYILPFYIIIYGVLLFARKTVHISLKSGLLIVIILLMLTIINSIRFIDPAHIILSGEIIKNFYTTGVILESGGFIGMLLASLLIRWFGVAGCWIFSGCVLLIAALLLINTPVSRFIGKIGEKREERRLIRENAHLDREDLYEEEDGQIRMKEKTVSSSAKARNGANREAQDYMDKESTSRPFRSGNKREIPVFNSSVLEEDRQEDRMQEEGKGLGDMDVTTPAEEEEPKEEKREYIPPSQAVEEPEEKKNSVLKYMNDDNLFGRRPANSVGLEEKVNYGIGFGLDGIQSSAAREAVMETGEPTFSSSPKEAKTKNGSPTAAGMVQTPQKLSNKEAREAMLSPEELNQSQKPVRIYHKPPIDLLTRSAGGARTSNKALQAKAMKLEETLRNFHVDARVIQVTQGPTVTRYEIQPAVGVKVSSIVRLSDDIALNLEAKSIRIEAPIPGKAAVGIEVENDTVTLVKLRDIIESKAFKEAKSKITFAVGKDIGGNAIVADLKSMPHLLIAGSTGSGKSVCINSIILSLLYKATPDEVKLILVDPKVVELGNYNGIPHLLIPVVTDPTKAAAALNWAVAEMTDRYKKFAEAGVRDLESYNEAMRADDEEDKVMPQVVIIIDELADLMMAAPSQIEESICRLAQMARAAGMHLIVATQRPSVDVITGVIKANIPSRIAFAVSSQVDSRTILDMQGAEKLVGKGDMLFNPMGMGKPIRVQGTFVSDHEVHNVIEFVKSQAEDTSYNEDILTTIERTGNSRQEEEADELLPEAIDLVVKSGQASVSMLQRRFRIGYNRAARIVDMMEARGIIGPQDGSRPRQVLMTEAELEQMEEETKDL